jgi:hypothetical protein
VSKASAHFDSLSGRVAVQRCGNCCELCGEYGVQACHIVPRSRLGRRSLLRYSQSNLMGLCPTHHAETEKNSELIETLVDGLRGIGTYDELCRQARRVNKYEEEAIKALMAEYREELKELRCA